MKLCERNAKQNHNHTTSSRGTEREAGGRNEPIAEVRFATVVVCTWFACLSMQTLLIHEACSLLTMLILVAFS